jgi:oligopeptide transport system permease protein
MLSSTLALPEGADMSLDTSALVASHVAGIKGVSLWQESKRRFFSSRATKASLTVFILIAIACLLGPWITGYGLNEISWDHIYSPPDPLGGNLLGTDGNGRDLLTRILYGGRISLTVGLVATIISVLIGISYGMLAGYLGGWVDALMMRVLEILYAVPFFFLVILLMVMFGNNIILIFVAIGAVEWLDLARIVRGQTMSIRRKEFIEAAETLGVPMRTILLRHIVPNVAGPVVVFATLTVPKVILMESFLSFMGLGVQEPLTSWGVLISDGSRVMASAPWVLVFPALFLTATIFCMNYIGDGLRDALDPRER